MARPHSALQRRPETAQDKLVKTYLQQNSPVFRTCNELSEQVWADPYADKLYAIKRERLRQSSTNADQSKIFEVYGEVVNELTAGFETSQLLENGVTDKSQTQISALRTTTATRVNVLDICMAPGGFAKVILDRFKNTYVYGLSLPPAQGGHHLIESEFRGLQNRFEIQYIDITMLSTELGGLVPSTNSVTFSSERPYNVIRFDFIIADGAVLESHLRSQNRTKIVEGVRLRASELVLALQRIKSGGTFIMLLHHMDVWETLQILHDFQAFATVRVKKPTTSHKASSSFYMIAEDVRATSPAAMEFVAKWKKAWKVATLEIDLSEDGLEVINSKLAGFDIHSGKDIDREVHQLLEVFGPTLIEMGTPVWQTQMEGLQGKRGRKAYGPGPEQSRLSTNESIWGQGGQRNGVMLGEPESQSSYRRSSIRSDDSITVASWTSGVSSADSEKSHAMGGNWNIKKQSEATRAAAGKRDRDDARRAATAKIQDIRGKPSWRSCRTGDENKVDMTGLVERAGNARAGE